MFSLSRSKQRWPTCTEQITVGQLCHVPLQLCWVGLTALWEVLIYLLKISRKVQLLMVSACHTVAKDLLQIDITFSSKHIVSFGWDWRGERGERAPTAQQGWRFWGVCSCSCCYGNTAASSTRSLVYILLQLPKTRERSCSILQAQKSGRGLL